MAKIDFLLIEYLKEKQEEDKEATEETFVTKKIIKYKKNSRKILVISMIIFDPIVVALYLRKGHHKWNNIPLKTFKFFLLSIVTCTTTLAISIYSLKGIIDWILSFIN
jgi:hypothetical protein